MTAGDIISTGRKRAGLTLKEVAAQIMKEDGTPISLSYLNDVEHNRRPAPSPHLLKQLAGTLHLSYEYLLFLAGDLPDDLQDETYTPEAVEAAFQAFRRTLKEQPPSDRE
jgi:transcriptional regulator with XRE-family HTH domain